MPPGRSRLSGWPTGGHPFRHEGCGRHGAARRRAVEPARPVIPVFTQQPFDIDQPQPQPTEPVTREVAGLFNLAYEVLLQVLTRFFTHTDETDEQLDVLVQAAFGIMSGILRPVGKERRVNARSDLDRAIMERVADRRPAAKAARCCARASPARRRQRRARRLRCPCCAPHGPR
jgi:hypothetical protein